MPFGGEPVFPLYVLLSWISPFAGCPARLCPASNFRSAIGLYMQKNGLFAGIAANLSGSRQVVNFWGLPEHVSRSVLDETSFSAVRSLPDPVAGLPVEAICPRAGRHSMELPPYGLVKLWETKPA
jgi:hypothetical protein